MKNTVSEGEPKGWLNVYKPVGMTSFEAVRRVQRVLNTRRVGHAGTLDPDACGVLPMAVGSATRLLQWCEDVPKRYRGWVVLGTMTTTGDGAGLVSGQSGPPFPSATDVEQGLNYLVGQVLQVPPQVSALKRQGKALHEWVREGHSVWPAPRLVDVQDIRLISGTGRRWQIEAEVGKGTYIRALVRDLGGLVGHAAHLEALERRQVGVYAAEEAVCMDHLEREWRKALKPPAFGLAIKTVPVSDTRKKVLVHGRPIEQWPELTGFNGEVALVDDRDDVLAVVVGPPWRYLKVLLRTIGDESDRTR